MKDKNLTFENLPLMVGELFELVQQINCSLTNHSVKQNDELMTIDEVANLFNVSLPTVHAYVRKGILVKYKMGSKTFFRKDEVMSELFNSKSVA